MTLPLSILLPEHVTEGSALTQKHLRDLSKQLIKHVDTFFKNGSKELENAALRGYKKGEYIFAEVVMDSLWGGPKPVLLLIYPSAEYNPDVPQDSAQPEYISRSGGYFTTKDQGPQLGKWGKIVLHLNAYIPILENYKPEIVPSSEYDIRDPKIRKKIYKQYKRELYQFVHHEAQHAVKRLVHGWEGTPALGKKYQRYYDQPAAARGLAAYTKIGDERESILAQIASEIEMEASKRGNTRNLIQILKFYTPSFRKVVVGMLDFDAVGKAIQDGDIKPKEYFRSFWGSGGKPRVIIDKFAPFDPEFIRFIQPKYQKIYRNMVKKLVDWWQTRFQSKPVKQEGSSSGGSGMMVGGGGHFPQPSPLDVDRFADDPEADSKLVWPFLHEDMTYNDLERASDPARKQRASDVRAKSLRVRSIDEYEAWTFSYKSNPSNSRTKNGVAPRWQGYIKFIKEDVKSGEDAQEIPCHVDCTCPDYKYRWAYNNAQQNAGVIGPKSWNKCINRAPRINLGEGLCKHLLALEGFLRTKIHGDRQRSNLFEEFTRFVNENNEFDVEYDQHLFEGFTNNKDWFIHEGQKRIKVVFENGEQLSFDVDYKGNFGENKDKWRRKAASTWKKLATEIHKDVEITEIGNTKETSWYECFMRALHSEEMSPFKLTKNTNKIFDEKKITGYQNAPKVVAGVDPVNFTPRV